MVNETEAARRAHALRNPNRLIRMKELRQMIGLGPSTIYKMMGEGRFPRSVHLGERTTACARRRGDCPMLRPGKRV